MQIFFEKNKIALLSAIIFLLVTILRLAGINSRPIWYDEAFSILFSEKGPDAIISGTIAVDNNSSSADIHPPFYYFLLWSWIGSFGYSLVVVRLLSIVAGIGIVALIFLIGRELFNIRVGLISALIATISPFQIHYAQEIRMYVFMCLWLLAATYSLVKGCQGKSRIWWAVFSVSAVLAQYTHNISAFYLISLALTPIFSKNWRAFRYMLVSGLIAILMYLPWLINIPSQLTKISQAYWIERPGVENIFTLLLTYTSNLPLSNILQIFIALIIALFIVIVGLKQTIQAKRNNVEGSSNGAWLLYMAFTPPIVVFAVSQWRPIFLERTFIASGAMFCIWLAWVLTSTNLPKTISLFASISLIFCFGLGIYEHINYAGFPYGPFESMCNSITHKLQSGDKVIHSNKLSLLPVLYYCPELKQLFISDPPGSKIDTFAPATQKVIGVHAEPNLPTAAQNTQRIWFIIFQKSIDEYSLAGKGAHPHLEWLNNNFNLVQLEEWGDLRVYLFERK